jgi:fumarylacetoacetase
VTAFGVASGFGVEHLPLGVAVGPDGVPAISTRIGDDVLDLGRVEAAGLVDGGGTLGGRTLNGFLAGGRPLWTSVRVRLTELLTDAAYQDVLRPMLRPAAQVRLALPFEVADYVDFYSSEHHAGNVGKIFRPNQSALPAAWRHLPIGYHGRAGTVVVSGTDIVRPCGQRLVGPPGPDAIPEYGPSLRLDIEAELGFVVGVPSSLGERVAADALAEHVFGVVLLNDWSARDIQAWEYHPLGPFLGKSFATSISGWVTPLDALAAARVPAPAQDPPVLPYLTMADRYGYDIRMRVDWNGTTVSRPPFAGLYWTPAQQLAHLTVNGASLRTGDLYASGTVSGPDRAETGSFLELTWGGAEPVTLADGAIRRFLEDGDTVTITATAPGIAGEMITLGEVSGRIHPAR